MRIYKILFFLPLLFLLSCGENKPSGILNHQQMQEVLVDVHIVDGSLFELASIPDTLYKYGEVKYEQVFKQHHTDSTQFKKSFLYYTNKPDELYDIYEKVTAALKVKVDSATKVKTRADSLERIKQNKINEALAKRAADSIARVNKIKADSARKKARADSTAKARKLEKKEKKKNAVSRK